MASIYKKPISPQLNLTKKNHYNPCFWTAFWNDKYLVGKRKGYDDMLKPRDVQIFTLNLRVIKYFNRKQRMSFLKKVQVWLTSQKKAHLITVKELFLMNTKDLKNTTKSILLI